MPNNNGNSKEPARISNAVIKRLPRYRRYLAELRKKGVEKVSSNELSRLMGYTASQIRQDLNNFGGFGQQGYGYNVNDLYGEISGILGLDRNYKMVIVGAGNLGQAIANYTYYYKTGFIVDAIFEVNPKMMMIGIVSRLTDQKGFDLIAYMMEEMCQDAVQFVILGTGEAQYENMFRHFAWKYDKKVSANIYYSEPLSHKIYAGCDAFLMPSLFEPCGLSQLMSLRYGTLPIVRETGGLKDTVQPYNEYEGTGTGFSFTNYNAHEMLGTVRYAERIYYDHKRDWNKMVDRAMAQDYSWGNSARQYQEMYDWLIG